MKIIVVGGTGLIGSAVVKELSERHEVIPVGYNSGDFNVDITSRDSIEKMYQKINHVDAVIATTGQVKFLDFQNMDDEKYLFGLQNKLMGQVNLVLIGKKYINPAGSFTLTSGIISEDPIYTGTSASMVNGAIDSFVKAAAIEMPDKMRINSVSPTVVEEAMPLYENYFRGYQPIPVAKVALAFSKSVEGLQTGQVFRVGYCCC